MRLIVDTSICRGHGQCAFVDPSVVTMGPDGKSRPAELALQGELASTLGNLALLYQGTERLADAETTFEEALGLFQKDKLSSQVERRQNVRGGRRFRQGCALSAIQLELLGALQPEACAEELLGVNRGPEKLAQFVEPSASSQAIDLHLTFSGRRP